MAECPFCGRDPYHYVDIGVGYQAVAVTCCELGIELFDHRQTGDVTLSREDFSELANSLRDRRAEISKMEDFLVEHDLWDKFLDLSKPDTSGDRNSK
jgi:hypothetical protein